MDKASISFCDQIKEKIKNSLNTTDERKVTTTAFVAFENFSIEYDWLLEQND